MDRSDLYMSEDGESYAVLVSGGWGAGWSTWNDHRLAFDKRVVELFMSGYRVKGISAITSDTAEQDALLKSWGYSKPYWGGWNQIHIEWVPFGVRWRLTEYDGNEAIEYLNEDSYNCF